MSPVRLALGASLVAAFGLGAYGWIAPEAAARGWLVAFLFCGAPLAGAVVLRLINRLTGGGWGETPGLVRLGWSSSWLWAMGAPVLLCLPLIYPWASGSGSASTPHQLSGYLSVPLFVARSAAILAGWSLLAPGLRRFGGPGFAAAGLAFYGLTIGVAAVDWSLSLTPGWVSSAAGMAMGVHQLMAAAATTLAMGQGQLGKKAEADLSGLLVATLLADVYFNLMVYLVAWYGDLPAQTVWHRLREGPGWSALITAALLVGDAAPLLVLALARRWIGQWTAPVAGALALTGLWLQTVWANAPQLGLAAIAPAGLACVLIVGLLVLVAASLEKRLEAAHGA